MSCGPNPTQQTDPALARDQVGTSGPAQPRVRAAAAVAAAAEAAAEAAAVGSQRPQPKRLQQHWEVEEEEVEL